MEGCSGLFLSTQGLAAHTKGTPGSTCVDRIKLHRRWYEIVLGPAVSEVAWSFLFLGEWGLAMRMFRPGSAESGRPCSAVLRCRPAWNLADGLGPGQAKTCLLSLLLRPKACGLGRALRYQIGCWIFMGTTISWARDEDRSPGSQEYRYLDCGW